MHTNWCLLIEISMKIGMLNFWLPLLVTALTNENYFNKNKKKITPLWHSWYCLIYGLAQGCNLPEMSETGAKDVNTSTAVLYYSQNNSELTFPTSGFQKCMKKMEIAGFVLISCKWLSFGKFFELEIKL